MEHRARRLLALFLMILCLGACSAAVLADGTRYPADQYFEKNTDLTKGVGVQIVAYKDLNAARTLRDKMLELGYDCYIYHQDDHYRLMCGKFRDSETAKHYRDYICSHTDRTGAYLTNVYLPEWAYVEFEQIYATDPFNTQGEPFTAWEKPTGPYYDGDSAAETRLVYTVQFSSGTSFPDQERNRDRMTAQGFDSFVLKYNGEYLAMSGMFSSYAEASARCQAILQYTDDTDAIVKLVRIPTSYVNYQTGVDQAGAYARYAELLNGYRWATDYLPADRASVLQNAERSGDVSMYVYYVYDIDGNGTDELIVLDCLLHADGAWAVFSCDGSWNPYLVAWGYPYGVPTLSACREKGILAMQTYYSGMASCEIYTYAGGQLIDARKSASYSASFVKLDPSQVDSRAAGYYVELQPYAVGDLSRLNGSPGGSAAGYTKAGVLAAARDAASRYSNYSTISTTNEELVPPDDYEFLRSPFQLRTYAQGGKAIYLMPLPEKDHGNLGTVAHQELVTILAERNGFYFFVTQDGRYGWNAKARFTQP